MLPQGGRRAPELSPRTVGADRIAQRFVMPNLGMIDGPDERPRRRRSERLAHSADQRSRDGGSATTP